MDFKDDIRVNVGDGLVVLREMTTEEWNRYRNELYPVNKGRRIKNNVAATHVKWFPKMVTRIENISRNQVPITLDNLELFPPQRVSEIMFKTYDVREGVDVEDDAVDVEHEDIAGN